jgi:putative membrane protein
MLDFSIPQRQSKMIIVFYLFKSIKSLLVYFVFAAIGSNRMSRNGWYVSLAIAAAAALSLISPILKYLYFTFYIEGDELIIQKGFLQKERKAIPLDRIQSININQDVVQRVLGIVSLEVDTAGSNAKELEIPGLDKAVAQHFKDLLQERKEEILEEVADKQDDTLKEDIENVVIDKDDFENTVPDTSATFKKTRTTAKDISETVILKLGLIDLLKVGITQNHLKSGGLAIGLAIGSWFKIKDIIEEYFADMVEQLSLESMILKTSISFAVIALVLFLFFSVLISLVLVINKFWDFSIVKKADDLEVKMGLFNKREIKIPLNKVQILEFHSNPLRKLLGFETAQIYQAQSTDSKIGSVEVPACKEVHRTLLKQLVFEKNIEQTAMEIACNPYSHARLRFYIVSVFALPLAGAAVYFHIYVALPFIALFAAISIAMAFMYGKNSKVQRDDNFVIFKKGWIFPETVISPVFKTQAVEKWRSIFLKRRKEAHFKLHTAAGTRGLRYLKEDQLYLLLNSLNNEVIASSKKWM